MNKNYISGWGNNKKIYSNIFYPNNLNDIKKILSKKNKIIPRGLVDLMEIVLFKKLYNFVKFQKNYIF